MKPTLTAYEQHQLELINREIKRADLEMKLYVWVGLPLVAAFLGALVYLSL